MNASERREGEREGGDGTAGGGEEERGGDEPEVGTRTEERESPSHSFYNAVIANHSAHEQTVERAERERVMDEVRLTWGGKGGRRGWTLRWL